MELKDDKMARNLYHLAEYTRESRQTLPLILLVEGSETSELSKIIDLKETDLPNLFLLHGRSQRVATYEGPTKIDDMNPSFIDAWLSREIFLLDMDDFYKHLISL